MCFSKGKGGPQKFTPPEGRSRDSAGNDFGSQAYHDKIRSDAAARRNESAMSSRERGTYGKTDKRTGSKSLISRIKSMF